MRLASSSHLLTEGSQRQDSACALQQDKWTGQAADTPTRNKSSVRFAARKTAALFFGKTFGPSQSDPMDFSASSHFNNEKTSWHTHQKATKTAIVLVISRLDDWLLLSQVHVTRKLPFCRMLRVCAWLVLTIVSLTPG
jgi:hypothetical protein